MSRSKGTLRAALVDVCCLLALTGGCASAPASDKSTLHPEGYDLDGLEGRLAAQAQRIGELENRLTLLEQEARSERVSFKPVSTVRIGQERASKAGPPDDDDVDDTDETTTGDSLPVLRLSGRPAPRPPEPFVLPEAPAGVEARVAVVPLPEVRAQALLASTGAGASDAPSPRTEYSAALSLLSSRRYREALEAFSRFVELHPNDRLADNAVYWVGEAHYALHQYAEAASEFERLLQRYPASNKTSDTLLKLGMCHRRMGDEATAQTYFQRVREKYPNSDAARVASREGSS